MFTFRQNNNNALLISQLTGTKMHDYGDYRDGKCLLKKVFAKRTMKAHLGATTTATATEVLEVKNVFLLINTRIRSRLRSNALPTCGSDYHQYQIKEELAKSRPRNQDCIKCYVLVPPPKS